MLFVLLDLVVRPLRRLFCIGLAHDVVIDVVKAPILFVRYRFIETHVFCWNIIVTPSVPSCEIMDGYFEFWRWPS